MPDSSKRDARGRILDALRRELLGPSDPNEAIQEFPTSRYIVGRLAPATDAEADDASYEEVDQARSRCSCILLLGIRGTTRTHPFVDIGELELPKPPDPVCW